VIETLYSRVLSGRSSKLCLQQLGVRPVLSSHHVTLGLQHGAVLSGRLVL
jgi:hypothetical protein